MRLVPCRKQNRDFFNSLVMKKNRIFKVFVAAFVALFLVSSFNESAVAQNNAQIVNDFIIGLRSEFLADEEMEIRSVERRGNVVVIDAYDNEGFAELYCEVLSASKRYLLDNPVDFTPEMKKVLAAIQSQGISFRYSVTDVSSGKKYKVDFTAKEFVSAYAFESLDVASDMSSDIFKYIPFNKIVEIMNTFIRDSSGYFLCENGRLYIVTQVRNEDFAGLKDAYAKDSAMFKQIMKDNFAFMNKDGNFKSFLDLAHANGYKFAMRFTSLAKESISIDLE